MSRRVALLGPQRLKSTLLAAIQEWGIAGSIATVTAGWQEREGDDAELHQHLEGRSLNLRLYQRTEQMFVVDPELERQHRQRQETLREFQHYYQVRLRHLMAGLDELERHPGNSEPLRADRAAAMADIRRLDSDHLGRVTGLHQEFQLRVRPWERDAVRREREAVGRDLAYCGALAIAGGHVAVLLNRLRMFGLGELSGDLPVLAWSAGSMAVCDQVVLFHDTPPQGAGHPEVLERGLGLAHDVVPLPHAWRRLKMDSAARMGRFSRRFEPSALVAMADGARLVQESAGWRSREGALRVERDGTLSEMVA